MRVGLVNKVGEDVGRVIGKGNEELIVGNDRDREGGIGEF